LTGVVAIWDKNGEGLVGFTISPEIKPFVEDSG